MSQNIQIPENPLSDSVIWHFNISETICLPEFLKQTNRGSCYKMGFIIIFSTMDTVAYIEVLSRLAVLVFGFFGNSLMILGHELILKVL